MGNPHWFKFENIKHWIYIWKAPRNSGYASKAIQTMESGWFTQKSSVWKSHFWANRNLLSSKYSKRELKICLSNTFPQISIGETD